MLILWHIWQQQFCQVELFCVWHQTVKQFDTSNLRQSNDSLKSQHPIWAIWYLYNVFFLFWGSSSSSCSVTQIHLPVFSFKNSIFNYYHQPHLHSSFPYKYRGPNPTRSSFLQNDYLGLWNAHENDDVVSSSSENTNIDKIDSNIST